MKKKAIIFSIIFTLILILLVSFLLPFLISGGAKKLESSVEVTEVKEYFQETEEEKITLRDINYNIEVTASQSEHIETVIVEKIETNKEALWNETSCDDLLDGENVIKYNITLMDKNNQIIDDEVPLKIKFPLPKDYDNNKIKVFRTSGSDVSYIGSEITSNFIVIYVNKTGTFTLVNDVNNANETCYIDISEISLEYKNILSLRVYSELLMDNYTEMKILLYKSEKENFTIKNADIIRTHNGNGLFKIENIEFKNIDDTFYIRLYAKNGNKEYYSTLVEYNILQYCINTYNVTEDENLKGLLLGTICYSQMSNDYEGNTSDIFKQFALATNHQKTLLETVNEITFKGKNLYSEDGENHFYGRNVDLNNKISYNIYLKPEMEENVKNLKLVVGINNETYTINFKKDKAYGFYVATFDKIQPYDINTPLFLKIVNTDGEQIGGTLTDSVGTFINEGIGEYTLEKDKNMFAATIFFMEKCEKYFNSRR